MAEEPRAARVGLLSLGVGLAAAGVGAALGLAAERVAVGRPLLPRREDDDTEDYGGLHHGARVVRANDGTALHVEVDEVDDFRRPAAADDTSPAAAKAARRGRDDRTAADATGPGGGEPLTVVLSHGYALSLDSWHFQRKALRGLHRLVLWDQRGHGRSGSGPEGSATIDQVGRDLEAVLEAVAPTGPLVLVGHSMGGMTVMSLAEKRPDLFRDRVLGVALVSTSAGGLGAVDFGLPGFGRLVQRVAPGAIKTLTRTPRLVERGRRLGSDLEAVLVRRYSYASPVSDALVRFTAHMIASTRLEVISDYLPTFSTHDKRTALATLDGLEVLVIVGDSDLLTPAEHSEEIVRHVPGAEHVVVKDSGHLLMLEHPQIVNGHLAELVDRALRAHAGLPGRRYGTRARRTVMPLRRRRRRRDAGGLSA
ncbi:alpha/beta fold hydrolase [Kineosporia sp. R_H_3]|uniref:alpha/beta fold hydrolase n=1 Tax=Kineosporia sp. R_H_3 TaxID=1961848 RepID=UPI000B4BD18C|nr:alpha/beta hydrolase [Kineosporia sp. R_H_3]